MILKTNRNGNYLNFYNNKFHVSGKVYTKGESIEVMEQITNAVIPSYQLKIEGSRLFIPDYAVGRVSFFALNQSDKQATTNVDVSVKKKGRFVPFISGVVIGAIATWFTIAYVISKK